MSDVGQKIQTLRRQAGHTRQEMARQLNVEYSHYLEIERGTIPPGDEVVRSLAGVFGVTATEIGGKAPALGGPVADPYSPTLRRLVLRQKALLELLIEKGVLQKSEFEEAYRSAGKGI